MNAKEDAKKIGGTFFRFTNWKISVPNQATFVALGDVSNLAANPAPMLALVIILIAGALLALKIRGALLIGIVVGTVVGIPLGVTQLPSNFDLSPPSLAPIFFKFEWKEILTTDMAVVLFTFLFVDMFDTIGTLIGVSSKAEMLDKDGKVPNAKQALFADAIGTTFGAMVGTSTVTTYVESASGVH